MLDVDVFFPEKDRFALAMAFNSILAAPSFQSWVQGVPLDMEAILHTPEGKPRASVFYIAHLSDQERMFFVALLLQQIQTWMRTQPGTTSLRALVYFDEVFGYFPPYPLNPPSKTPLLTLLKQARAFGVGLVLVTQNPVDLDYKGLTNAGTWLIGRLQTDRDKARVLEGMQGALQQGGSSVDSGALDRLISSLKSRVFLMHNVHEGAPQVFGTRWAMSYLAGPLTKVQVESLMGQRPLPTTDSAGGSAGSRVTQAAAQTETAVAPASDLPPILQALVTGAAQTTVPPAAVVSQGVVPPAAPVPQTPPVPASMAPVLPSEVAQYFLPVSASFEQAVQALGMRGGVPPKIMSRTLAYEPFLLAVAAVHFSESHLRCGARSAVGSAPGYRPGGRSRALGRGRGVHGGSARAGLARRRPGPVCGPPGRVQYRQDLPVAVQRLRRLSVPHAQSDGLFESPPEALFARGRIVGGVQGEM